MTNQQRAVLSVGLSTRRVEALLPGLGERRLFYSFGQQIPDLSDFDVTYWVAGGPARRLQQVGLATELCSPGNDWLPSLDTELTGRQITGGVLADIIDDPRTLWVKPAEAKIPSFPAGAYTAATLQELYVTEELQPDLALQWTPSILNLDYEHRFFVLDGKVVTGSPYRVVDGINRWGNYAAAEKFAMHVLAELDGAHPPHFTLDVGLNTATDTWLVIEGNRSWSSGVYNCDATLALASIDAASHWSQEQWQWRPDSQIIVGSAATEDLEILPLDDDTIGFVEYQPSLSV